MERHDPVDLARSSSRPRVDVGRSISHRAFTIRRIAANNYRIASRRKWKAAVTCISGSLVNFRSGYLAKYRVLLVYGEQQLDDCRRRNEATRKSSPPRFTRREPEIIGNQCRANYCAEGAKRRVVGSSFFNLETNFLVVLAQKW